MDVCQLFIKDAEIFDGSGAKPVHGDLGVRDGRIAEIGIALGGIAAKPWRAVKAEAALRGGPATAQAFATALVDELADAAPLFGNAFKIELAQRTLGAVLADLSGSAR